VWVSLVIVATVCLRAAVNFGSGLPPKTNAAYYLLQARSIVERDQMMAKDTPLVFHATALLARALGASKSADPDRNDAAVTLASGLFDAAIPIALGLGAFGLAAAMGASDRGKVAAVAYACLSIPAVIFWSDFQKNSLGLAFVLAGMAGTAVATGRQRAWGWLVAAAALVGCGATHMPAFGAGVLCMIAQVGTFGLRSEKRRSAALAAGALAVAVVLAVIAVPKLRVYADPARVASRAFSRPFLLTGQVGLDEPAAPPDVAHLGLVWAVAILGGTRALRLFRSGSADASVTVLGASLAALVLALPLLGAAIAGRSFLMASTPLVAVVAYLWSTEARPLRHPVLGTMAAVTLVVVVLALPMIAIPAIPPSSRSELRRMRAQVPAVQGSLLVARHGLEWWGAFDLRARCGTQDFEVAPEDWRRYPRVYYLRQVAGRPPDARFREVRFPQGSQVVYRGQFFELAQVSQPPSARTPRPGG
jgi:hypothetical protein